MNLSQQHPLSTARPGRDTWAAGPGEGVDYEIGPGVTRAAHGRPYERQPGDPVHRPLKIFALDPAVSLLEGSVAQIKVPYERLAPGPVGAVFAIEDGMGDEASAGDRGRVNLDDPLILIQGGLDPSPTDYRFHRQMIYAVCSSVYAAFQRALGRNIAWGFGPAGSQGEGETAERCRLSIQPHYPNLKNAWYDKANGRLCFGSYPADKNAAGRNLPGGMVHTCLSHDIVTHEVTHALLDGLREKFSIPTNPDVPAFHEAFADLVALSLHFSHERVVQAAIRKTRGRLERATLLTDIAQQFGYTTNGGAKLALRTAIDVTAEDESPVNYYNKSREPHAQGSVLSSAVFEAFRTIFRRKTERYILMATGGRGILPEGELPPGLQEALVEEASQLARQFLDICIRAIDYCPPVDLYFGEFLRAVITADRELMPEDKWGYREAWIDAFLRRKIYPPDVPSLSEDSLSWDPPDAPLPPIEELSFASLRFRGDPGRPASASELRRQAAALGWFITRPGRLECFGLVRPGDRRLGYDLVDRPCVHSIRSTRRSGLNGRVLFDLVAEVTQRRLVRNSAGKVEFEFFGGSTIILDPEGNVRYVIRRSILNQGRIEAQRQCMQAEGCSQFWSRAPDGMYRPNTDVFRLLHPCE